MGITYEDLEKTREQIFEITASFFNKKEKEFLIFFKKGDPQWDLFPLLVVQNLPAIQWKFHNIKMMDPKKRYDSLKKLKIRNMIYVNAWFLDNFRLFKKRIIKNKVGLLSLVEELGNISKACKVWVFTRNLLPLSSHRR